MGLESGNVHIITILYPNNIHVSYLKVVFFVKKLMIVALIRARAADAKF